MRWTRAIVGLGLVVVGCQPVGHSVGVARPTLLSSASAPATSTPPTGATVPSKASVDRVDGGPPAKRDASDLRPNRADRRRAPLAGVVADRSGGEAGPAGARACPDDERVEVFEAGQRARLVCPAQARVEGRTLVDLSDRWAPWVFNEAPELGAAGRQPYRETYLALADERALPERSGAAEREARGEREGRGERERFLELFGILPTLRVLRARALDQAGPGCAAGLPRETLERLRPARRTASEAARELDERRVAELDFLERRLERERVSRGQPSFDALLDDPELAPLVLRHRRVSAPVQAMRALQGRLVCERLLREGSYQAGLFDLPTMNALRAWQRKHMVVSRGRLDPYTLELLGLSADELAYRSMLRVLRERVIDALGWIEDGSAGARIGTVFGRSLDPPQLRAIEAYAPLRHAAPDLVSKATEDAARALGWIDAAAARRALHLVPESGLRRWTVALALDPPPPWHRAHMALRAEIDRGDVWYAFPYRADGRRRRQPVHHRPTLTLFVDYEGRSVPLARFRTTIGGWKPEVTPSGRLGLRYKPSPAGPRVWRHLVASPAWLPPPSTPDSELVRRVPGGGTVPDTQTTRPGFRSAYGLVMLVHHKPLARRGSDAKRAPARSRTQPSVSPGSPVEANEPRPTPASAAQASSADLDEEARFGDEGVRTHGSVSYESILEGSSHGCHRLFNHLALRLAGFLLRHRTVVRVGPQEARYQRTLRHAGPPLVLRVDFRGYLYELTPPVPVEVLEGRVLGAPTKPIAGLRSLPPSATP